MTTRAVTPATKGQPTRYDPKGVVNRRGRGRAVSVGKAGSPASRAASGRSLPVISLFSGALGLDVGLEEAGFDIRVAVEPNESAAETIKRNRPNIKVLTDPIEDLSTEDLLAAADLEPGEPMLVSAGPSCQTFSTVGHRRSLQDPRGKLFMHFLRVVTEARPRFFVMEQVRGVLSAAIRHRPLAQRGPGFPPLKPEEQFESAFRLILSELAATHYYTVFDLVNVADFGVSQRRERVIFVGSRDGESVRLPAATHSDDPGDGLLAWRTLADALEGIDDPDPVLLPLSPAQQRFMKQIPAGCNWQALPERLQRDALGKAYVSWGGRAGFLRRLSWDRPTPALTTRPNARATMFVHPDALRTLTVREYAAIQGFPDDWEFCGGKQHQYTQIGNAVPPPVALAVGREIVRLITKKKRTNSDRRGRIACESADLIRRLEARPRTVLNPDRMRAIKGLGAAREWMKESAGPREPLPVRVLPARAA